MKNGKFEVGTVIMGRDLKGSMLCKILSDNMKMQGFQYKMGLNEDVNQLELEGSCKTGLHFCLIKDICMYLNYGCKLAVVDIPDDDAVYVDEDKFRAHRLEIKKIMQLSETETWKYLYENGADIMAKDNHTVRLAAKNGYLEVVKYLHKNGADITAFGNEAFGYAVRNGHLEVVKYLHENGADIMAWNNYAIRCAAENGHLEVVKYLHENRADITAQNNLAVRCAAENGHLEVVKYLHGHGADIMAQDNYALYWATRNEHADVVEYLKANM